jgi:hypothetical protein
MHRVKNNRRYKEHEEEDKKARLRGCLMQSYYTQGCESIIGSHVAFLVMHPARFRIDPLSWSNGLRVVSACVFFHYGGTSNNR